MCMCIYKINISESPKMYLILDITNTPLASDLNIKKNFAATTRDYRRRLKNCNTNWSPVSLKIIKTKVQLYFPITIIQPVP